MTGAASALRSIRINPADAGIGPGSRVKLSVFKHFDFTAVALPAAAYRSSRVTFREARGFKSLISLHHLCQRIIERTENACTFCVMGSNKLSRLFFVAPVAVPGTDNGGNEQPFMEHCIRIAGLRFMTFIASD